MTTVKPNKHDKYVQRLCKELHAEYDTISTHVPISTEKRMLAEIDILAEKDGEFDIFEVKCSRRITKARMQKRKIHKHTSFPIRNFFFYCGSSQEIVLL